jgi:putative transposase
MRYETDLTDSQWELVKELFERRNNTGKHLQTNEKRELVNAVRYFVKTGCQWRMLPKDLPHWSAVASFFYRAKEDGLWEKMCDLLVRKSREKMGRNAEPTYGLIDSQSAKTSGAAEERGIDGGKK